MKRLGLLTIAQLALLLLNHVHAQPGNLLINGDFETDESAWTISEDPANDEIVRIMPFMFTNHTPGGTNGVWLSSFFGAHPNFESTPVDGILSQTVPAVPHQAYEFSGWSRFEPTYSGGVDTIDPNSPGSFAGLPSPTETLFEMEFLDAGGTRIGNVVELDVATEQMNDNIWREHSLLGTSPAGTASVRVAAMMLDGVFNIIGPQSLFFDDFSLIAIPEPTTGVLGLMMLVAGGSWRRRVT